MQHVGIDLSGQRSKHLNEFIGQHFDYVITVCDRVREMWNSVLGTSLLIGFIEEIPYRGFILQKLDERYGFWTANLLSSLLFLSIHLPGWIALHLFSVESAIFIFLFGIVMAIVFKYGQSLWGPIITHSLNDFITSVIFRL